MPHVSHLLSLRGAVIALALTLGGCATKPMPDAFVDGCADIVTGVRVAANAPSPLATMVITVPSYQGARPKLDQNARTLRGIAIECRGNNVLAALP
jgi:hypothetical protein